MIVTRFTLHWLQFYVYTLRILNYGNMLSEYSSDMELICALLPMAKFPSANYFTEVIQAVRRLVRPKDNTAAAGHVDIVDSERDHKKVRCHRCG